MSYNKAIMMGNLTRDPEVRTTSTGQSVANFTIAVNHRYGQKEEVLFLRCEAWGKTAEIAQQYLQKGNPVIVDGRLRENKYNTREGEERREIILSVENLRLMPRGTGGGDRGQDDYSGGNDNRQDRRQSNVSQGSHPDYSRDEAPNDDHYQHDRNPEDESKDDLPF